MINKGTVREKNRANFVKCLGLRKAGLSYSEIRQQVPMAKSTLSGWLKFAGLTLTAEHLNIQKRKRIENWKTGVAASRITREHRNKAKIDIFVNEMRGYFTESLFIAGIIAYEAEGSKRGTCRFSNSDYRMVQLFLSFVKKYLKVNVSDISYRIYIHATRTPDLGRIMEYWSNKLSVNPKLFSITWKRNKIAHRRLNQDYVGQMGTSIRKSNLLIRKLSAISSIIMAEHYGIV